MLKVSDLFFSVLGENYRFSRKTSTILVFINNKFPKEIGRSDMTEMREKGSFEHMLTIKEQIRTCHGNRLACGGLGRMLDKLNDIFKLIKNKKATT